jgi:hypothetical protein
MAGSGRECKLMYWYQYAAGIEMRAELTHFSFQ